MRKWTDEELAAVLEGLAEPEEPIVGEDAARVAKLDGAIVELPAIAPPAGLLERTLGRLAEEGLLVRARGTRHSHLIQRAEPEGQASSDCGEPAGLFEATMARLEDEGLVRPARARLAVWRAAAALLVTAGLAGAVGYSVRAPRVLHEVAMVPAPPLFVPIEVERRTVVEVPVEKIVEKTVEVVKVVEKERVVEVEKPAPEAEVASAAGVERWDAAGARWVAVEEKSALAAGTIVRGARPRSEVVLGARRYRLGESRFVVSAEGALVALPDAGAPVALAAARADAGPDDAPPAERVPRLIALWSQGSSEDRARAQRELTRLWIKLGAPGPNVIGFLANVATKKREGPSGPPTTADGWEEWWRRVGDR